MANTFFGIYSENTGDIFDVVILTYILSITYCTVMLRYDLICNRQMRGEELQGLKIEELIELEELLEAGLCSVVEEKVCLTKL